MTQTGEGMPTEDKWEAEVQSKPIFANDVYER